MSPQDWMSERIFNLVHRHNLVYNTCWEDPRLDRQAMQFGPDDNVLVITSAGCNALDYVLTEPNHVYAIDVNPRQNALLELKLSGIRNLDFDSFFEMFGRGRLKNVQNVYHRTLRASLSGPARKYWDRKIVLFDTQRKRPFYFRGTSGSFAWMINAYIDRVVKMRSQINALLDATSVEQQQAIYYDMEDRFWTRSVQFAMGRDTTLSMLGVPRPQRQQVEKYYDGGIAKFVRDCVEFALAKLPLADNYFWRVYLTGEYSRDCCPEYLRPENFQRLRHSLADRVSVHTNTVQGFLRDHHVPISRFVLLDHMDWMSGKHFPLLEAEWQAIVDRATPDARIIWRSGGLKTDFVNRARVYVDGQQIQVGELLRYNTALAEQLHARDRVHTYASFYIADVAA